MKSDQEYLTMFHAKYNELAAKDELWRLRVTEEEFMSKIQELRSYEIEMKKAGHLNDYHIDSNIKGAIGIMLMDILTLEETIAQVNRNNEVMKILRANEIPKIREQVKQISLPFKDRDCIHIGRWLFYDQITKEDLSDDIWQKFKNSYQYNSLVARRKLKDEEN